MALVLESAGAKLSRFGPSFSSNAIQGKQWIISYDSGHLLNNKKRFAVVTKGGGPLFLRNPTEHNKIWEDSKSKWEEKI